MSDSDILAKYNFRSQEDDPGTEAIFRNAHGAAFKPRWPRREAETETAGQLEIELEVELPINLAKGPLRKLTKSKLMTKRLSKKKIDKLFGPKVYGKFRARVRQYSRIVFVQTSDKDLDIPIREGQLNGKTALLVNNPKSYATMALCEEELRLEAVAGAGVEFNILIGGVEISGEYGHNIKVIQSTGIMHPKDGAPIDFYRDLCREKFFPKAFDSLLAELTLRMKHLVTILPKSPDCVMPNQSKSYLSKAGYSSIDEYLSKRRSESDRSCAEAKDWHRKGVPGKNTREKTFSADNKIQRCVNVDRSDQALGYCREFSRHGQACLMYRNEDGSVTEDPKNDESELLMDGEGARPCDRVGNLTCQVTQEGGFFTSWYSIWRPWVAKCSASEEKPKLVDKVMEASRRAREAFKNQLAPADFDFPINRVIDRDKQSKYLEPSGLTYLAERREAFFVSDDLLSLYRVKFDDKLQEAEGSRIEIELADSVRVHIPDRCQDCYYTANDYRFIWWELIEGFEGITHAETKSSGETTFYLAIESMSLSETSLGEDSMDAKKRWRPAIAKVELRGSKATVVEISPLGLPFYEDYGRNKGIESIHYWVENVDETTKREHLFTLCETPSCSTTPVGTPTMLHLVRPYESTGPWNLQGRIALPIANFPDYSGMDMKPDGTILVASQDGSRVWRGKLDFASMTFQEIDQYAFPIRENKEIQYCNIEGIAWMDDNSFLAVSDAMGGDEYASTHMTGLPKKCAERQQSMHRFHIP